MANKKTRVLLTVLNVILAAMSLLLLIVSPVAGMVGLVLAVLIFVYVKKSKSAEAAAEETRARDVAAAVRRASLPARFNVVGIGFRSESLDTLMQEATGFARPSNRDRRYYKYDVYEGSCVLEPEPDNAVDPNAVKVVVNKAWHIGYIPKEKTGEAKELIAAGKKFRVKITGGPYKEYDNVAGKWEKYDGKYYADIYVED